MKKIELMKELEKFNETDDLVIMDWGENISVDIDDFDGFDENWGEIEREVQIDEEEFIEFLQKHCESYEMDFYSIFEFEDCFIRLGYTSYDI